jgi:hypothetical protein
VLERRHSQKELYLDNLSRDKNILTSIVPGFCQDSFLRTNLHMIIHGFMKFAKPVDEHHLQVLPSLSIDNFTYLPGLSATTPNG